MSGKEMFRIEPSYPQGVVMNGVKKKKKKLKSTHVGRLKMEIQFPPRNGPCIVSLGTMEIEARSHSLF